MAKPPKEPDDQKPRPSEDEVLRRMLNTPPKPRKAKPTRKKHGRDDVATKPDKE